MILGWKIIIIGLYPIINNFSFYNLVGYRMIAALRYVYLRAGHYSGRATIAALRALSLHRSE